MIPTSFKYYKANSVGEAIKALSENSDANQILAGGHSLIPAMKLRLNSPEKLIDISRIPELQQIKHEGNELVIGAAATHTQIAASDLVSGHLEMLADTSGRIGDIQVRNMGTIGGSIAHADPAADWPAAVLAGNARIIVAGPKGKRSINADKFFTGFFETALNEGEIITEIRFPRANGTGKIHSVYEKFVQPASRFAIVGCAIVLQLDRGKTCTYGRVAFTGVSENAFRDNEVENMLFNKSITADVIAEAANAAAEGVDVMGDHFASSAYRKHLAKIHCKRALLRIADF